LEYIFYGVFTVKNGISTDIHSFQQAGEFAFFSLYGLCLTSTEKLRASQVVRRHDGAAVQAFEQGVGISLPCKPKTLSVN
jgi:hypothetical protein